MSVIRRKIGQGGTARPETATSGGADRAFRLALARAARDTMGLALDVTAQRLERLALAELVEAPPERSLMAMLDEEGGDGLGLLVLSPPVLAGMVEMLTTGRVTATPPPQRRPTRTDAAMLAAVIDAVLQGLDQALEGADDRYWAEGWRYASFIEDARPLGLLLEDVPYRLIRAEVSLSDGAKTGTVLLALPEHRQVVVGADKSEEPATAAAFAAHLVAQVEGAEAELDAVIGRVSLPLSRLAGLKAGEVLPLPLAGIDRIRLTGVDGRLVAEGRLGQTRGLRAIRITEAAEMAAPAAEAATGAEIVPMPRAAAG